MPERGIFHDVVKVGLEKEGWVITADFLLEEQLWIFKCYSRSLGLLLR